jgi:hypothetical protein
LLRFGPGIDRPRERPQLKIAKDKKKQEDEGGFPGFFGGPLVGEKTLDMLRSAQLFVFLHVFLGACAIPNSSSMLGPKRNCLQDPSAPCCGPNDPKDQCDALKGFFVAASQGDGWLLHSNWLMGGSFCAPAPNGWHGITCVGGKVYGIDLSGNELQGTLEPTVFTAFASGLTEFSVAENQGLGGSIPTTIGKAINLCVFNAYGCSLNGTIPDVFGNLDHFTPKYCTQPRFDLHFNRLHGPLAKSIGDMDGLTYFSCANNNISGTIPQSFAKLTNLETLGLANNQFTGSIEVLASMTKLVVLFLRYNRFGGKLIPLPDTVQVLDVDHNQFSSIDPQFCTKASGMPALNHTGGCESDWPSQKLGTCCLANNDFTCKLGKPECLENCEMACGAPTPPAAPPPPPPPPPGAPARPPPVDMSTVDVINVLSAGCQLQDAQDRMRVDIELT